MIPLLLLYLILIQQSDGARPRIAATVYTRMLSPTEQHCTRTQQCIGERPFCANGSVCLHNRCFRLPDFPCSPTEWCDERARQCKARSCQSWRDCDDGVFCNGEELCVAGLCTLNPGSDCTGAGDLCDERLQRCTRIQSVQVARQNLLESGNDMRARVVVHSESSNASNTTVPVGSISNAELAWILVGVCGFVSVLIFFWFIANTSRRRAPTILIDHQSGGDQVYTEEVNY